MQIVMESTAIFGNENNQFMQLPLLKAAMTICIGTATLVSSAQALTEKRIEFEVGEDYENFRIEPFGKNGFLLLAKQDKGNTYKIERYNTDLVAEEKKMITIPKGYYLRAEFTSESDENMLYANKKNSYVFYQVDPLSLEVTKHSGILPKKTLVTQMIAQGDFAYVSSRSKKGPVLNKLNVKTGKLSLIPINITPYSPKDLSIEKIQIIEETKETFVFINAMNKKDHNMYVMQISEDGDVQETFNLSKNTEKKISSVSASAVGAGEYIFTGTYSSVSSTYSEGMYICSATKGDVNFMKFYNFTDFEEFFSYLPERKQEKIEKKKERYDDKNKELKYNYLIAEHPIKKLGDQYVMIGEAYYPTYRQEAYTTTVNGRTTTSYRTVFDGFQYTHATIAAFDLTGEKLWDRTFEMWPGYKPYVVRRFISVSEAEDKVDLLFASSNSIKSLSVNYEGNVEKEQSASLIQSGNEDEKVKYSNSNLTFWYDTHFIAFGYQTLKNSEEKIGNKKRSVYFVNKVTYD